MSNHGDQELPVLVREIKQETEQLIRIFDQAFLRTCGIICEKDIEKSAIPNMSIRLKRFWPTRRDTTLTKSARRQYSGAAVAVCCRGSECG